MKYDRLGRRTHEFVLARDNDLDYDDACDVDGDCVLEERQMVLGSETDKPIMTVVIERHPDDIGPGMTLGSLDSNADNDLLSVTAIDVKGRAQITAFWYDEYDRVIEEVSYGTYADADFDRSGLSVPARSDTALRKSYRYADNGDLEITEDAQGVQTRYKFDDSGRKIEKIDNYQPGVASGLPSGSAVNRTRRWAYQDGLLQSATVVMPAGETDQVTTYVYGVGPGDSPGASSVESKRLLREIRYPDQSSADDVFLYAYDAQGRRVWQKDPAGNVLEMELDASGSVEHRRVTALAGGYDGSVRRISVTRDRLGRLATVTQYDNASVSSGSVIDQTGYTYTDWGKIESFRIDRDSILALSGTGNDYRVSYGYEKVSSQRNTVRRTSLSTPQGKVIAYSYSNANNALDDDSCRVTSIKRGPLDLVTYEYAGKNRVVGIEHPQPAIFSRQYSTSAGYQGLDRFNRVISDHWTKDVGSGIGFYASEISYDRRSGVTLAERPLAPVADDSFYDLDALGRLTTETVGDWDGSTIASAVRQQGHTLTQSGNWASASLDLNMDGDYSDAGEYDDERQYSLSNELLSRDLNKDGAPDVSLVLNALGQVTTASDQRQFTFDPFGRITSVANSAGVDVAKYRYNGLGYRIGTLTDTDGSGALDAGDSWFYSAYSEQWREICRYRGSDSAPKAEYTHHVDRGDAGAQSLALVQRRRDTSTDWNSQPGDGSFEEKNYYCQNWRGDVCRILNFRGGLVEAVGYSAHGVPIGHPAGDDDWSGGVDSIDLARIQNRVDGLPGWGYSVWADLDLDGDVDATDKSIAISDFDGISLGWAELSSVELSNDRGYSGLRYLEAGLWDALFRAYDPMAGRWRSRDPLGYIDGPNLYGYAKGAPLTGRDPIGLYTVPLYPELQDTGTVLTDPDDTPPRIPLTPGSGTPGDKPDDGDYVACSGEGAGVWHIYCDGKLHPAEAYFLDEGAMRRTVNGRIKGCLSEQRHVARAIAEVAARKDLETQGGCPEQCAVGCDGGDGNWSEDGWTVPDGFLTRENDPWDNCDDRQILRRMYPHPLPDDDAPGSDGEDLVGWEWECTFAIGVSCYCYGPPAPVAQ